jgi:hypothetical protein
MDFGGQDVLVSVLMAQKPRQGDIGIWYFIRFPLAVGKSAAILPGDNTKHET